VWAGYGGTVTQSVAERRRQALGEFVRSRRERTTPEMVGMPPTLRRRTPGLRREEVAMLCGIGVTWYTWLEQGRPINVSSQVLGALSRVLRLDATERAHLFALAELTDPLRAPRPPEVSPAVQAVLDALDPVPAVVVSPHFDLLASNPAYLALTGDYRVLPCPYRNTMALYFCETGWRRVMGDWADNAPRLVAKMRTAMAADVADPRWQQLLELLNAHSPEFRELWQRNDVAPIDSMVKVLHHDEVGTIHAEVVHTWLTDRRGTRLTVYTPGNEAARAAYERLRTVTPRTMRIPGVAAAPEPVAA
jgi:transcriptional regulator with XRE-family HTH domain